MTNETLTPLTGVLNGLSALYSSLRIKANCVWLPTLLLGIKEILRSSIQTSM